MNDQTILRKPHNKEHPYVVITKTIFEDAAISWKAKGLMGYLLSRPDDWTVRIGDLVKRSTDGRAAVRSALKELEEHGYLVKHVQRDEHGRWAGIEMTVSERPVPVGQRTVCDFPTSDKPPADKPPAENRTLLSIDSLPNTDLPSNECTKKDPPLADSPPRDIYAVARLGIAAESPDIHVTIEPDDDDFDTDYDMSWPTDRQPATTASQEPPEQRIARMRDELGTDPLQVAAVVEQKRAEAEHPDFTDATKDIDAWADKPLKAFCVLVGQDYARLRTGQRNDWPRQLRKWAESWEDDYMPTPQETFQCIQGLTQSEHAWKTFTSPRQTSFQETMDIMLSRLRGGQPWNATGKRNGGSSTPRQGTGGRHVEPRIAGSTITLGAEHATA